jgi:hypothetical protein
MEGLEEAHMLMGSDGSELTAADMRQDNDHVMESFLASSPPPWNAGLESVSNGSAPESILWAHFLITFLAPLQQQQGVNRSTSIKHRASNKGPNDEESWDEDDDMGMEDIPDSNFQILDSSLHGKFDGELHRGLLNCFVGVSGLTEGFALGRKRRTFPSVRCTTIPIPIPDVTRGRR